MIEGLPSSKYQNTCSGVGQSEYINTRSPCRPSSRAPFFPFHQCYVPVYVALASRTSSQAPCDRHDQPVGIVYRDAPTLIPLPFMTVGQSITTIGPKKTPLFFPPNAVCTVSWDEKGVFVGTK